MKRNVQTLIFLLLSVYFNQSFGFALNYGFLDDTPGAYFTPEDWRLFEKAQLAALNSPKQNIKKVWKNPTTGSWGSFVPSNTLVKRGLPCRELTIVNSANYRIGQSTLTFCKVHGMWRGV